MLDTDIPKRLPQQPVASVFGTESTEDEFAPAKKVMTNAKAVSPDSLPVELLKLGLEQERVVLTELQRLITLI